MLALLFNIINNNNTFALILVESDIKGKCQTLSASHSLAQTCHWHVCPPKVGGYLYRC